MNKFVSQWADAKDHLAALDFSIHTIPIHYEQSSAVVVVTAAGTAQDHIGESIKSSLAIDFIISYMYGILTTMHY